MLSLAFLQDYVLDTGLFVTNFAHQSQFSFHSTRSKSGQLTHFKKGAFHLWEQLQGAPIVPLVIYGAYDLFPPGHQICMPGKVYVRFLEPICVKPSRARSDKSESITHRTEQGTSSDSGFTTNTTTHSNGTDISAIPVTYTRDQVERLLRQRMLEAWRDGPSDAGDMLSPIGRAKNILLLAVYYAFLYVLANWSMSWLHFHQWTLYGALGAGLGASVAITLLIFLYLMYLSPLVTSLLMKKKRTKED